MAFSLLIIVAIGLGIDALMVAISCGLKLGSRRWGPCCKIAGSFGLFQGGMTALGIGVGRLGYTVFKPYAHYIAVGIFLGLALKSLQEFYKQKKQQHLVTCLCQRPLCLFILAVATSVDAFAVGIVLACYEVGVGWAIGTIALTALLMSWGGLFLGHSLGRWLNRWPSLAAMVIFMILAVKALQGAN